MMRPETIFSKAAKYYETNDAVMSDNVLINAKLEQSIVEGQYP